MESLEVRDMLIVILLMCFFFVLLQFRPIKLEKKTFVEKRLQEPFVYTLIVHKLFDIEEQGIN